MIFKIRWAKKSTKASAKEHPVIIADRARDARDWPRAAQYYREALDREPARAPIWVQYGHALKEMGQPAEAETAYRTAAGLEPLVADTHLQLGHVLKIQNRRDEALAAYQEAVKLDPSLDHARDELAALDWTRRRFADLERKLARRQRQAGSAPISRQGVWPNSIIGGKAGRLAGTIEHWDGRQASGWMFDAAIAGRPLTEIEVVADGKLLGRQLLAPRGDLLQAGEAGWTTSFECGARPGDRKILPALLETVALAGEERTPGPRLSHPARRTIVASSFLDTFLENVLVMPVTDVARFRARLGADPRICVCAMWAPGEKLQRHQQALLQEIRRVGFAIVVVNSALTTGREAIEQLRDLSDLLILRGQGGADFASWIVALGALGQSAMDCAQLLLCNDSCIGPLVPLGAVFTAMEKRGADVWGITDSWDRNYHLQSYFQVFSGEAVRSRAFWRWACGYTMSNDRQRIIDEGEIALSGYMSEAGFKLAAYCEYRKVVARWLEKNAAAADAKSTPPDAGLRRAMVLRERKFRNRVARILAEGVTLNSTHWFWDVLVEDFGSPFIKKGLILHNPDGIGSWNRIPDVVRNLGRAEQLEDLWDQSAATLSGIGVAPLVQGAPRVYPPSLIA